MRPLLAHCHLDLGRLYYRTDKHEQAREHQFAPHVCSRTQAIAPVQARSVN
jgi:hypothetical protein